MPPKRNERHKALKFCKFLQCWGACTLFRNAKDYCKPETIALPFFSPDSRHFDGDRARTTGIGLSAPEWTNYWHVLHHIRRLRSRSCIFVRVAHCSESVVNSLPVSGTIGQVLHNCTIKCTRWMEKPLGSLEIIGNDAVPWMQILCMETASLSCIVSEITLIFIYKRIQNSAISSTVANRIVAILYTWTRYFTSMKMVEVRCRLQPSN